MSDPYAADTAGAVHRSARLDHVLSTLLRQAPDLEAAAVVSFDGLPMASALPQGMDEDRVAAMSAALLSLGERAAQGLGRGDLSQVYVEGDNGTVFLVSADDEAVLVAVGRQGAKVGLMLFEVKQAAQAVANSLRVELDVEQPPLVAVAAPVPVAVTPLVPSVEPAPLAPVLSPVPESAPAHVPPAHVPPPAFAQPVAERVEPVDPTFGQPDGTVPAPLWNGDRSPEANPPVTTESGSWS